MLHIYKAFQAVCTIYNIHNTPAGPDFAQYIMPILFSCPYDGVLVTDTVVSFAAKFQPHIFSVSSFAWSNFAIIFEHMILHDSCLLST
jgi:hypothetical protein